MENFFNDSNFNESSEMSSMTVDWGKVEDFIVGTFVRTRRGIKTQFGTNSIYEIEAEKGSFHKLTKKVPAKTPTDINKGDLYGVWGRGDIFDGQMNSLKPGQIVKLMYVEDKPSTMGNDAKIIKIYAPRGNDGKALMNEVWLESQPLGDL